MNNLSKALCWLEMVTEAYEGCGDSESTEYGKLLRGAVLKQQSEIERLKKSILEIIEAGNGLIKNNGHLSESYHQAKSDWYRAKHAILMREQGDE